MNFDRAQDLLNLSSTLGPDARTSSLRDYVQATLCMFRGEMAESERLMSGVDPHVVPTAPAAVALAVTYREDLDRAADLNRSYPLASPSARAWHHYVNGEIAGRRREWTTAASHYASAIGEAQAGGVSFVVGVATIGLLSAQVAAGHHREAINGYLDLLEHYERTGGWKYQWTTVQNIADLLDAVDEPDSATLLRQATRQPPNPSRGNNPGMSREEVIAETRRALGSLAAH